MPSFLRISALLWADVLVIYALFVMQNYLTDVWGLSFTHAAGILNIWSGICMILPVFFLFLVDVILGNFLMLVLSSIAYSLGIGFIAMSMPPVLANSTGTCKHYKPECIGHTQKVLMYMGLALVAVGIAGHLVSHKPFLKEQEDRQNENDLLKLIGFTIIALVPVIGAIALPYIKAWSIRFGIPAICTVVVTLLFLTGWNHYDKKEPKGSPITNVCRVFVAFASKLSDPFPVDSNDLYRENDEELQSFSRTRFLRCLEKAAIVLPYPSRNEQILKRWKLCSVAEVEEAKIAVRMIPMWLTFIVCGIVSSIGNTYFVEQGKKMNRHIGKWNVPLPIFLLFFEWAKTIFGMLADRLISRSRRYRPPLLIAMSMIFSILCCITAARIEIMRLHTIRKHGLLDKPDEKIPMSVFSLLPQFILLAGLDKFFEKGVAAFFDDQAPESMRNYLQHFTKGVSGLGYMSSVLSVHVMGKISESRGNPNWFQDTLNKSRLDRYYWFLAGFSSVNLLLFGFIASMYRYRNREARDDGDVADGAADPPLAGSEKVDGYGCCC